MCFEKCDVVLVRFLGVNQTFLRGVLLIEKYFFLRFSDGQRIGLERREE